MEPQLSDLHLNFGQDQMVLLNLCLAFLMFGVALDIQMKDFRLLMQSPRSVLAGLTAQWIVMPLLTLALVYLWKPLPGLALGMFLVAACPGGNVSNFLVHVAGGNRALSVTLTAFTTVFAFLTTPLLFLTLASAYPPGKALLREFAIEPVELLQTLVILLLTPLLAGMGLRAWAPSWADRIRRPVKWFSLAIFCGIVIAALAANFTNMRQYLGFIFLLVLVHNFLAFAGGYLTSRFFRIGIPETRSVLFEAGIQNSGLGLIIVLSFYDGMPEMALVAAWWGIWHLIAGGLLALWISAGNRRRAVAHPRPWI